MPMAKKHDTGHYAAYAERRANSSLQMLAESSTSVSMWVDVGSKDDVSLSKTTSDWKVFCANRATTTIDTTLHNVVQRLFQATESSKYQELMRSMWGDAYLDARVIEVIGADPENAASMATVAPQHRNVPSVFHKVHKRTSVKWFATLGKSKLSKASEFHLVEFIGLVYDSHSRIQAIYIYQESMSKVDDAPLPLQTPVSATFDRVRVDGLIMKFEALELPSGGEYVMLSLALQRQPSLLDFGFKNPAEDLVLRFAKGYRAGLRRTSAALPSSLRIADTGSWVRDQDRPACSVCARAFHPLVRRRHHCRKCGEVVCFQCSNLFNTLDQQSSSAAPDVRLCNRCVVQQQADAGRHLGVIDANALKEWLDEELAENNPDLFDVPPPATRRPLPSGGAFTGTLEVNVLAATTTTQLLDTSKWNNHPSTASATLDAAPSTDNLVLGPMMHPPPGGGSATTPPHPNSNQSPRTTSSSHGRLSADKHMPTHPGLGMSTICLGAERRNFDALYDGDDHRKYGRSNHSDDNNHDDGGGGGSSKDGENDGGIHIVDPPQLYPAVEAAMRDLHDKIGGPVHFLVVSFSDGCDAIDVMVAMEQGAPGVPFVGGLSARGICDEAAWVSMKRGGLVALWGIHDPLGSYTVGSTGYDEFTAKHNVADAVHEALHTTPNPALAGLRRAVPCPVLGGCSVLSAHYQGYCTSSSSSRPSESTTENELRTVVQISSAGGSTIGMTFALCSPSVETSVGWFSGHNVVHTKATAVASELSPPMPCMGVVTSADSQTRVVYEIDHRPAATVYKEVRQVVQESLPSLHVNATPVVTAVDDVAGTLSLTTPIRTGTTVALMHTSADVLKDAVKRMAVTVMRTSSFDIKDVDGCLMFLSAGVQVVLGSSMSMSGLVGAFKAWSGGASFLGLTSFGEVGHLAHDSTPLCDALMFSYLIFSNQRRNPHA
ncbi:hypothetical protein DYB31_009586 [Aphanomyces astaci]|uniref:FYVE-type domain-containing protein n=1 Tax=Aphanomyces astaci TaxID=112090 RepID=A0A397FC46_APHAT|nr:hypothetical protein DYB31_009586 [Aphanomyces astaci]